MLTAFLLVGFVVARKFPISEATDHRSLQVDGLRALLAFGVMSYHFFGAYHLVFVDGKFDVQWMHPVIKLLGSITVPVFFSITSYLFTRKICSQDPYEMLWFLNLYIGRFFRLAPLVGFVCIISVIIYVVTDDKNIPASILTAVTFGFFKIKSIDSGSLVDLGFIFGPQWSLHSEWIFYFSLPLLGIILDKRIKPFWLILTAIVLLWLTDGWYFFVHWDYDHPYMFWAFLPGIVLGYSQGQRLLSRFTSTMIVGLVAIILMIAIAFVEQLKFKIPVLTIFLSVLLSRNPVTKFLESYLLRSLGETTYSIYLLHGVVQYIAIKWLLPPHVARNLPEWIWWSSVVLQVGVTVLLSRFTFEFVEKPGIALAKRITCSLSRGGYWSR
jgi:peptidoglycan/LPS O-acetylase OafA/YrhL